MVEFLHHWQLRVLHCGHLGFKMFRCKIKRPCAFCLPSEWLVRLNWGLQNFYLNTLCLVVFEMKHKCFGNFCFPPPHYDRVKAKLQEIAPDRVDPFMANAPAEVKKILGNIKNYQVGCSNWWFCHAELMYTSFQKFGVGELLLMFLISLASNTVVLCDIKLKWLFYFKIF